MCFFNVGANSVPSARNILTYSHDYGSSEACGMDKSTGIFTVVTEGLYHFSINVVRKSKLAFLCLIILSVSDVGFIANRSLFQPADIKSRLRRYSSSPICDMCVDQFPKLR